MTKTPAIVQPTSQTSANTLDDPARFQDATADACANKQRLHFARKPGGSLSSVNGTARPPERYLPDNPHTSFN